MHEDDSCCRQRTVAKDCRLKPASKNFVSCMNAATSILENWLLCDNSLLRDGYRPLAMLWEDP